MKPANDMYPNRPVSPAIEFMDYEKVSVHEARKALHDHRPVYRKNWARDRLPGAPEVLLDATRAWLLELPAAVRPVELANRFPRIANKLAKLWSLPPQWEHTMSELLIVRRGDTIRQGFPAPVARELAALSTFHAALFPAAANVLAWM